MLYKNMRWCEEKEKKGHQKFSALKWKFFPKKVIRKFGRWNIFPPPQTRRQVSAHGRVSDVSNFDPKFFYDYTPDVKTLFHAYPS